MKPVAVALIPARARSRRITNKNIRPLMKHPMLAYTVRAAIDSGAFDAVVCATDSKIYADVARYYGAEVPFLRPTGISGDQSPDIEWVVWVLKALKECGRVFDVFSILRPTSPFRSPDTIRRAWALFMEDPNADSLRAIEKCKQHPGKMWVIRGNRMLPLLPYTNGDTPWHSNQYAALPEIYIQNASLEIAWSRVALEQNSIAGAVVVPFMTYGREGFDINDPEDLWMAEQLIARREAVLPVIKNAPYKLPDNLERDFWATK